MKILYLYIGGHLIRIKYDCFIQVIIQVKFNILFSFAHLVIFSLFEIFFNLRLNQFLIFFSFSKCL